MVRGRNVLFVGDLLQIVQYRLGCTTAVNIWKETVIYDELTINERQKSDQTFSVMLDSVRRGCPDEEVTSREGHSGNSS